MKNVDVQRYHERPVNMSKCIMTNRRFLYCCDCNAVHHVTPFDTDPSYELVGLTIRETPCDDRGQFMTRHSGHRVGELISLGESHLRRGQILDPMKVTYIVVTDGRESFVLRSFRKSIADPLSYEVLPIQLVFWKSADDLSSIKTSSVTTGTHINLKPGNSPVHDIWPWGTAQQEAEPA